jgi:hypothetical protein
MPITQGDLDSLGISGISVTDANRIVGREDLKDEGDRQMRAIYDNAVNTEAWFQQNAAGHPLQVEMQRISHYIYERSLPEYEWPEPPFARPT